MSRGRWTVIIVVLFALLAWVPKKTVSPQGPWTPRIVIVLAVDTCRADHLGCYGYMRNTSPNIDRLAREGVLFENAFSQSNESLFSYGSLLSGVYPERLGPLTYDDFVMPPLQSTLASALQSNGDQTAGFVAGGHLNHGFGFSRGFTVYDDADDFGSLFSTQPPATKWLQALPRDARGFLLLQGYDVHAAYHKPMGFDHLFDPTSHPLAEEIVQIANASDNVYRLQYFYALPSTSKFRPNPRGRSVMDTSVFEAIRALDRRTHLRRTLTHDDFTHIVAHYDGGVAYADVWVGLLMARLHAMGVEDETLVVLLGDHGEELREDGFLNHRADVRDASLHVPLIFWGKGLPAGQRVKQVVELTDVLPTVLDLCAVRDDVPRDGHSLRPLLEGGPDDLEAAAFAEGVDGRVTVRSARARLVCRMPALRWNRGRVAGVCPLPPLGAPGWRMYRIEEGLGEREMPPKGAEAEGLRARLETWQHSLMSR